MKTDKIKELLQKYYQGQTTLDEEKILREALKSDGALPDEQQADRELFSLMHALSEDGTSAKIDLSEKKVVPLAGPQVRFAWVARIAAGFALLIIGVLAGMLVGRNLENNLEVQGLRQDIDEMKQLVALSQLHKESASERIMAAYSFGQLDSASEQVLDALIYALQNDKNANVKNAAAEALFKFGNHDKVRKAFINGLVTQSDPMLQIKLIEMLVAMNEKRALPKLKQMLEQETQMKVVKQKAAEGIVKLL
jgi:hypothetical protein